MKWEEENLKIRIATLLLEFKDYWMISKNQLGIISNLSTISFSSSIVDWAGKICHCDCCRLLCRKNVAFLGWSSLLVYFYALDEVLHEYIVILAGLSRCCSCSTDPVVIVFEDFTGTSFKAFFLWFRKWLYIFFPHRLEPFGWFISSWILSR